MTWRVSASLMNCNTCGLVSWCMHSRPLPNPADTSHPKRNGMSEHGGFIKWKTETKMEMIFNLHLQTETSSYQTPSEFSISIKPQKCCLTISPSIASKWNSCHSSATRSQHFNWRPSQCWNLYKLKYFVPNI